MTSLTSWKHAKITRQPSSAPREASCLSVSGSFCSPSRGPTSPQQPYLSIPNRLAIRLRRLTEGRHLTQVSLASVSSASPGSKVPLLAESGRMPSLVSVAASALRSIVSFQVKMLSGA